MQIKKVMVIGGGISGLSTSFFIRQQAKKLGISLELTILEKESQCGGKIKSVNNNGYLFEWGPNGFLDSKPQTLALCADLGISDQILVSNDNARRRFIYSNKKLYRLPHSPTEFLTCNLLSLGGRLRVLAEMFIPKYKGKTEESVAAFARRRLGQDALDKLIAPMANGIFAGNPETMSLKACFPRIHQLEQDHGSLIKAMLKLTKTKKLAVTTGNTGRSPASSPAGPGGRLTSFYQGIQTLTDNLAESIGRNNIIHTEVTEIQATTDGRYVILTTNGRYEADLVISAVPAYAASKMFSKLDIELKHLLSKIKYAPLIVAGSSYERSAIKHDMNGFGYLLARDETIPVLGSLWDSSIFANRAPDGKILLRTMLGGARQPGLIGLSDAEIIRIVREGFKEILEVDAEPLNEEIIRHAAAIPEYNLGHGELVSRIEARIKAQAGLFITGNAFYGIGINDCVLAAANVADNVVCYLQATSGGNKH